MSFKGRSPISFSLTCKYKSRFVHRVNKKVLSRDLDNTIKHQNYTTKIRKRIWLKAQEKYFGPAVIVGQLTGVQNSVRVPCRMFTWLKKSTAVTQENRN